MRALEFREHAKLKHCPFCGSLWKGALTGVPGNNKGLIVYDMASSPERETTLHVACLDCGAGQTTVEKWNMRAAGPVHPGLTDTTFECMHIINNHMKPNMSIAVGTRLLDIGMDSLDELEIIMKIEDRLCIDLSSINKNICIQVRDGIIADFGRIVHTERFRISNPQTVSK